MCKLARWDASKVNLERTRKVEETKKDNNKGNKHIRQTERAYEAKSWHRSIKYDKGNKIASCR